MNLRSISGRLTRTVRKRGWIPGKLYDTTTIPVSKRSTHCPNLCMTCCQLGIHLKFRPILKRQCIHDPQSSFIVYICSPRPVMLTMSHYRLLQRNKHVQCVIFQVGLNWHTYMLTSMCRCDTLDTTIQVSDYQPGATLS